MISRLKIENFKSLADFEIRLHPKLTLLVGLNGAGKTSVLQALDFVSSLVREDPQEWLDSRGWEASQLNSKFLKKSNITFELDVKIDGKMFNWVGEFNRKKLSCVAEELRISDGESNTELYVLKNNRIRIASPELDSTDNFDVDFNYHGSILRGFKIDKFPSECARFMSYLKETKSLEVLAPNLMRRSVKGRPDDIGIGGEKLPAFLHHIDNKSRQEIQKTLSEFYANSPRSSFMTKGKRGGSKFLQFLEPMAGTGDAYIGQTVDATHVNDGMLRMLAYASQLTNSSGVILCDEIENGVHPELTEALLNYFQDSDAQVIATTHSPIILNFLDDDLARECVQFIFRPNPKETTVEVDGEEIPIKRFSGSQAVNFFDLPSTGDSLGPLGAGEVFVDVSLVTLTEEAGEISKPRVDLEGV